LNTQSEIEHWQLQFMIGHSEFLFELENKLIVNIEYNKTFKLRKKNT